MQYVVAALYHFFDFAHFETMRAPLLARLNALDIKGSLLIAPEGINGTLAGSRASINAFLAYLETDIVRSAFEHKESLSDHAPFRRTKVRLKKETISLGVDTPLAQRGVYVSPQEWNDLLDDPETIIIDARNDYEVHLGSFEGALNPQTRNFKQLPQFIEDKLKPHKKQKIATFCTGGIRCEKLTSWMVGQGFEQVYHLQGGILRYLEEIPQAQSKWQGECYVFDERIAVGHGLTPSQSASICRACGHTLTPQDRAQVQFQEGQGCAHCTLQ